MHELTIPNFFRKPPPVSKNQVSSDTSDSIDAPAPLQAKVSPASGADTRRIQTRRSGVHGKGVFAVQPLAEGEMLIEYGGEVISWKEALRRHPHDPLDQHFALGQWLHRKNTLAVDARAPRLDAPGVAV